MDQLKQLLKTVINSRSPPQKAAESNEIKLDDEPKKKKVPASKMNFKTVTEVYVINREIHELCWWLLYSWDAKAYKYKITEINKAPEEVTELDEYIFVVHTHIDKCDLSDSW